jgi:Prolipoprotein diacylglyceryl transferase
MSLRELFNHRADRVIRPAIRVLRKSRSCFQVCGYTGLVLAICLTVSLIIHLSLSLRVLVALALSAMATFLTLAMITKIIVGEESLIYYHQEIAIVVVAAVVLWLLQQPVLPYLDVTILGVGLFLACGRIGCLMVGCCYGRPSQWGVRYRAEHAAAGFPSYFVGVRLFPVQLIEALCVFGIVGVGVALVLGGRTAGEALAWYVGSYGVMRFGFEFLRGDPSRRYLWGFSEAQWTSLVLMCAVVSADFTDVLDFDPWHVVATAALAATMMVVACWRRLSKTTKYELLHPRHVNEIAEAIETLSVFVGIETSGSENDTEAQTTHVARTSHGIRISTSIIPDAGGRIHLYALSSQKELLSEESARTLAALILQLKHPSASCELVRGSHAVFHALVRPPLEGRGEPGESPNLVTQESHHAF